MPHNWLIVDANTPEPWNGYRKPAEYRKNVIEAVALHGGGAKFVELYWDATKPVAYVLVDGPKLNEPDKLRKLAEALPTLDVIQLLGDGELRAFARGLKRPPKRR